MTGYPGSLIKIGLASLNTTVAAVRTNTNKAIDLAREASLQHCTICVLPEMTIAGYYPEDLNQWPGFVSAQWVELQHFMFKTDAFAFPTVFVLGLTIHDKGTLYNVAAVVWCGRLLGLVPKMNLANENVFHEARVLEAGYELQNDVVGSDDELRAPFGNLIFKFPFGTIAPEVCEDVWSGIGPMIKRTQHGADIVINLSASPFRVGVNETRRQMLSTRSADNQTVLVYCNLLGGNDSLVYDGESFVYQNGVERLCVPMINIFEPDTLKDRVTSVVIDMNETRRRREASMTWQHAKRMTLAAGSQLETKLFDGASFYNRFAHQIQTYSLFSSDVRPSPLYLPGNVARPEIIDPRVLYFNRLLSVMTVGLKDYFEKTNAFKGLAIALSGGRDSVLTLVIAWLYARHRFAHLPEAEQKAAIKDFIHCYSMPTKHNKDETKNISRILCEEMGVTFIEDSIQAEFEADLDTIDRMTGVEVVPGSTLYQNSQARIRGKRMWNIANAIGFLWLQTGNMSEKATGYTTIGGDMMGGFSLISNAYKSVIILLLHHLQLMFGWQGLKLLNHSRPSAELADGQSDEADLMPFEVLDNCIELLAGQKKMPLDIYFILRDMFEGKYTRDQLKIWIKKFVRLFFRSIFKWVQAPQAVHLGSLDLDRERALHLPVVSQCEEWLNLDALDTAV
ncbi:TPA: NAD(+) synthase [Candidatus Falkowbacteria bacterium]|nr:NAD(+) synthase [Candidatus Falkowbacteria bacterium]